MLTNLINLFVGCLRATLLGFGGGPSTVPLYEHEAVEVFKWMTKEEFGQALAFGNALPGPIATKLTMYIGHKVAGWPGATVALFATTIPIGIVMIGLFAVLGKVKESPYMKGALAGIRPVIFVMLAMMAVDFAKYTFPKAAVGVAWAPFAIAALYYISVQYFNMSPIWGVVGALIVGGLFLR